MQAKATADVTATLTTTHDAEIHEVIQRYETDWLSLAAHENPSIQSKLATGGFLWYWGNARSGTKIYDEPFWLITKSADVTSLHVLEYSPERVKALASVIRQVDEYTPKGTFTRSYQPREVCRLYLFVREDSVWKVADLFDMTRQSDIARDWENFVAWEKDTFGQQIMGDLPLTDCSGYSIP